MEALTNIMLLQMKKTKTSKTKKKTRNRLKRAIQIIKRHSKGLTASKQAERRKKTLHLLKRQKASCRQRLIIKVKNKATIIMMYN